MLENMRMSCTRYLRSSICLKGKRTRSWRCSCDNGGGLTGVVSIESFEHTVGDFFQVVFADHSWNAGASSAAGVQFLVQTTEFLLVHAVVLAGGGNELGVEFLNGGTGNACTRERNRRRSASGGEMDDGLTSDVAESV